MNYYGTTPILLLSLTFSAFIAVNRGHHLQFGKAQAALRILVALPLLLSGILLHFFRYAETANIVPPGFKVPIFLVLLTGVLEIAGAIGLLIPRYRKNAALGIALLLIAIFPANIYVAGKTVAGIQMPGIAIRTVLQIIYMLLVLISAYGLPVKTKQSASD